MTKKIILVLMGILITLTACTKNTNVESGSENDIIDDDSYSDLNDEDESKYTNALIKTPETIDKKMKVSKYDGVVPTTYSVGEKDEDGFYDRISISNINIDLYNNVDIEGKSAYKNHYTYLDIDVMSATNPNAYTLGMPILAKEGMPNATLLGTNGNWSYFEKNKQYWVTYGKVDKNEIKIFIHGDTDGELSIYDLDNIISIFEFKDSYNCIKLKDNILSILESN